MKPPLGIMPEWRMKELRLEELNSAIVRYILSPNVSPPQEWLDERQSLREWIYQRELSQEKSATPVPSSAALENDWKILGYYHPFESGGKVYTGDEVQNEFKYNFQIPSFWIDLGYKIAGVQRVSDGAIFNRLGEALFFDGSKRKIGAIFMIKDKMFFEDINGSGQTSLQEIQQLPSPSTKPSPGTHICKWCGALTDLPDEECYKNPANWKKEESNTEKPILFTTEDGVKIFENDDYWYIDPFQWAICSARIIKKEYPIDRYYNRGIKKFSTKEKAEEYRLMNKPVLSVQDIISFPFGFTTWMAEEIKKVAKQKSITQS